jgi:hypothetical protein
MFIEREKPESLRRRIERQRQFILELLQKKGRVSNVELIDMGIFRAAARIEELRKQGHIIDTESVGGGLFYYTYRGFNPRQEKDEATVYMMRDGDPRAKKSMMGPVEVLTRSVFPESQFFHTFLFFRNQGVIKNPVLYVVTMKNGEVKAERVADTVENRKRIKDLMRECDLVFVRRVSS